MENMSKSIFVIDTPACCGECPMSGTDVCRKWSMKEARTFPKDCPLKTAYDVDMVVERLEELREEILSDTEYDNDTVNYYLGYADLMIEAVKSGGMNPCTGCNSTRRGRK